jgi:hypothetical protein
MTAQARILYLAFLNPEHYVFMKFVAPNIFMIKNRISGWTYFFKDGKFDRSAL